jgi:hypothetical protein
MYDQIWDSHALLVMHHVVEAFSDFTNVYVQQRVELKYYKTSISSKRKVIRKARSSGKELTQPRIVNLLADIKCMEAATGFRKEFLAFLKVHQLKFKAELKGHWEAKALCAHVSADVSVYLARVSELNSKVHMALKPINPVRWETNLKNDIAEAKTSDPVRAARMMTWDTDLARVGYFVGST